MLKFAKYFDRLDTYTIKAIQAATRLFNNNTTYYLSVFSIFPWYNNGDLLNQSICEEI